MTARGKFWLCSFILGFALGILAFYILGQPGPAHPPAPTSQIQPYQVEPFREAALEGTGLKEFTQEAKQLGTTVLLKAHASDRAAVAKAFKAAFDRIHEIELIMTIHRPGSPLAKINAAGRSRGYKVPQELGRVIATSLDLCSRTGGALDITVRPLIVAYKSAEVRKRAPTQMEISVALQHVGYQKVSMSEDLCTLTIADDGMALDLSATAKGYAADEGAKVLRENGIEHAYVEAGGDIRFIGTRGDGKPWRTGIRDPGDPEGKKGKYLHILELTDCAVCTSGNYAPGQGYRLGKQRVSHIVDPRTGKPCDRNPSVTVIAPDGLTADALATALSVMGKEGLRIVEEMEGVEALVITLEGGKPAEYKTGGFARFLKD